MRGSAFASPSAISPVRSRLPSLTTTTCHVRFGIAESDVTASSTVFAISSSSLYARKPTPSRTLGCAIRGSTGLPAREPASRRASGGNPPGVRGTTGSPGFLLSGINDPSRRHHPTHDDQQEPRVVGQERLRGTSSSSAPVHESYVARDSEHNERDRRGERASAVVRDRRRRDAVDGVAGDRRQRRQDEQIVQPLL